jgi:hypothetical protein
MTVEDWETVRDSGVDFSKAGKGGFADFIKMSYDASASGCDD